MMMLHRMLPLSFLVLLLCFCAVHGDGYGDAKQQVETLGGGDSIYDILKARALPMGLLPKGIKDFRFDESGYFEAYLDQACNAKFESELHYDRNVSGTISYGQIGSLSGISAQDLFLWFPVKGIRVDVPSSGLIYFDVGVVLKQFSLSLFETPRDCAVASDHNLDQIHNGRIVVDDFLKSEAEKLRYTVDQNFGRSAV
ncbi:hypothetical protein LINGRAHAP2_LOCUS30351 [Linum grandiflorum]